MADKQTPRSANLALGLGIASLLLGWIPVIGWALILSAIITGAIGLRETRDAPGRARAVAGLVLGIGAGILVLAATLLISLLLITVSSQDIDIGMTTYDVSESTTWVRISGIGQNQSVDHDRPIHLSVQGINNSVYVTNNTKVVHLELQGISNTVSLPADSSPSREEEEGLHNKIYRRVQ